MADVEKLNINALYSIADAAARARVDVLEGRADTIEALELVAQAFRPAVTKGSYWKTADGTIANSPRYARTNARWNGAGYRSAINLDSDVYEFGLVFFDADLNVNGNTSQGAKLQYIPETAVLFAINFHRRDNATITDTDVTTIRDLLKCYGTADSTLTMTNAPANAKAVGTAVGRVAASASLTQQVVLASIAWDHGYIASADGTIVYDGPNTIFTPQYIYAEAGTVFTSSNGYRFSVSRYSVPDVSGYIERSSLGANDVTISENCYIRMHISKPSGSSEPAITNFEEAAASISNSQPLRVLAPLIYKDVIPAETYVHAKERFIEEMNKKAQQIGMTSSVFADAAGYDIATNRVTARDMVRMGIEACAYDRLCRVWQTSEYTFKTFDLNHHEIVCEYGDDITPLDSVYPLLGKKNGYMPLTGSNKSFTMVAVCLVNNEVVVGAIGILGTMSATDGRAQRVPAMKELMDNVKRAMEGTETVQPTLFNYGCAAILPKGNVVSYERRDIPFIYEYQADTQFVPASCTKVLTAMTMLDYITDVHEKLTVLASDDLTSGSGLLLQDGDIINYEQVLYLMMLPSSGPSCRAIARAIGEKMIIAYD